MAKPNCSVDGCERLSVSGAMCASHRKRWRTYGDAYGDIPFGNGGTTLADRQPWPERFWANVNRSAPASCWEWQAHRSRDGYGRLRAQAPGSGEARMVSAHRVAYELSVGPVPEGLQLDHLCRNRACCNPAHLEPVTCQDNVRRGISPPAAHAAQAECINGHPFDEANTYFWRARRSRACRACGRAATARYIQRKAAAVQRALR